MPNRELRPARAKPGQLTSEDSAAGSWNQLVAPHQRASHQRALDLYQYTRFAEVIVERSERQIALDGLTAARWTNPLNTLM